MPTEDDNKDDPKVADPAAALESRASEDVEPRQASADIEPREPRDVVPSGSGSAEADEEDDEQDDDGVGTPAQLGAQRFVYAAYFAAAVAIAFLLSKTISFAWSRLALWKPQVGEPDESVAVVLAALIGALVAFYYYRDEKTRTLAEEVASELGKVTWPTRDEVVNGTFVVLVTTLVATAFFALMDRFWGFVTNLVYGA